MVTTNSSTDYPQLHDTVQHAKKSKWSRIKSIYARLAIRSRVFRFFVCISSEQIKEMEDEARLRDAIRGQLLSHEAATAETVVEVTATAVFNATGYDLTTIRRRIEEAKSLRKTEAEWEEFFAELGVDPESAAIPAHTEVRVATKFAAAMVLCLRAKFGSLALTEANRLLVERAYLRICREGSVRQCDVVGHSQAVMNAFFSEGVLDQLCTTRIRAPQWLRDAFGFVPMQPAVVC